MAQVAWTTEATRWLKEIHDYIAEDNPATAARVVQSIYERAQILRVFPELGYRYERVSGRDIRILLWGHYRIAYLVKPRGDIDILGVFHGAMEIERYLK